MCKIDLYEIIDKNCQLKNIRKLTEKILVSDTILVMITKSQRRYFTFKLRATRFHLIFLSFIHTNTSS